jgi:hypothetical protein
MTLLLICGVGFIGCCIAALLGWVMEKRHEVSVRSSKQ